MILPGVGGNLMIQPHPLKSLTSVTSLEHIGSSCLGYFIGWVGLMAAIFVKVRASVCGGDLLKLQFVVRGDGMCWTDGVSCSDSRT